MSDGEPNGIEKLPSNPTGENGFLSQARKKQAEKQPTTALTAGGNAQNNSNIEHRAIPTSENNFYLPPEHPAIPRDVSGDATQPLSPMYRQHPLNPGNTQKDK